MKQRIGNVGILNLLNATEESIKGIESIENVGIILYKTENAHLLTQLSFSNIGKSLEVPDDYRFFNGILTIDENYLQSIQEPLKMMVNGLVVIDRNIHADQVKSSLFELIIHGKIYCPDHLSGAINQLLAGESTMVDVYHGAPPRFENGMFTLTNPFLESIDEPSYLVVNGVLTFPQDLNLQVFEEKISKLEVNGKITIYEEQESILYKKVDSLTTCKVEVIPSGYLQLENQLRLNQRSIRRYRQKNVYTKKPIIFGKDVSREAFIDNIAKIHSESMIICHETLEDLVYEHCTLLETEVLTYEQAVIMIEGEETWSNDQLLALNEPANFIVRGKLTLAKDVAEEVLLEKMASLDLLGEIVVENAKIKGSLQNIVRLNTGSIVLETDKKDPGSYLNNIGELAL